MQVVLCAALALALLHVSTGFEWEACEGSSSKYADIKDVTLTPADPAPGVTVDFAIEGTAKIDLAEGNLDIAVQYMGLPIYSESRDLCDMTMCPIQQGELKIVYQQYLPPIVPPGPYNVTLEASSAVGQKLLCLNVLFDVTPPTGASAAGIMKHSAAQLLRGHRAQA